jgi:hypothetical protein
MRVDPEELVELRNHGSMKLRSAVARAMLLPPTERRNASIVRQSQPSVLKFKTIKDLSNVFERSRPCVLIWPPSLATVLWSGKSTMGLPGHQLLNLRLVAQMRQDYFISARATAAALLLPKSGPNPLRDLSPASERKGETTANSDGHPGKPKVTHRFALPRRPAATMAGSGQKNATGMKTMGLRSRALVLTPPKMRITRRLTRGTNSCPTVKRWA